MQMRGRPGQENLLENRPLEWCVEKSLLKHQTTWSEYYTKEWLMCSSKQSLDAACTKYFEGLQWVLDYYTGQRPVDTEWYFPYYVPPNQPVVHMVNPRGRVHIPTEGSGRRRGNTIFKMIARSMGKKVDDNEGGFLPMLAARVVGKKLLKNVGKKVAKKAVENVVENEGGFLPMLAARVVGKKLLQKVGKKVAKNAVENAVLGEGNARGKSLSNLQALDHNRKERAKQAAFNSIPTVASVGTAVGIHHGKKALKNKINELTGEGKKKAKKAGKPKYDVI
jgi:hypothetical protein